MIISEKGKFIFVHVQKNAGTSIEKVLKKHFPDARYWHGRHGHAVSGINEIGRDKWDEYYSFAFVRNPWDRMVSWYSMIQAALRKLPPEKQSLKEPFDSPFWNYVTRNSHDFEGFLKNCTDIIFEKGCYKSYAFNQVDYLSDEDSNVVTNFVGRFENLVDDTAQLFKYLGIDEKNLPKINTSQHYHYRQYYTTETRDLVAQRFCRDIEVFKYRFA